MALEFFTFAPSATGKVLANPYPSNQKADVWEERFGFVSLREE